MRQPSSRQACRSLLRRLATLLVLALLSPPGAFGDSAAALAAGTQERSGAASGRQLPGAGGLVGGVPADEDEENAAAGESEDEADEESAGDDDSAEEVSRPAGGGGAFVLGFESTAVAAWKPLAKRLEASEDLRTVMAAVNDYVDLPKSIPVTFRDCDEENAWYDGDAEEITLCYDLVASFETTFRDNGDRAADVATKTLAATAFIVYHEMGHALIGQLELPITGREEDAVDELAALVLINAAEDDEGEQMAYSGAEAFYLVAADSAELTEEDYADVHSLDLQRYYNILCLIYGSDTAGYADLVKDGDLPEGRAESCEGEFAQKTDSWTRLLGSNLVAIP